MITFLLAVILLIVGYIVYSKVVERIFGINDQQATPAYANSDGMDFVPMSWWKGSLIQLLNIAGLGPIFGAILGALYGPIAFIWIVVGCIFAGAVHDYFSGMLSLKHNGAQYPALVGKYLGKTMQVCINLISIVLMILVAAAFTAGPAQLITELTPLSFIAAIIIIFSYFLLAALLPVNKIIGRIYPIFGGILIFMALSVAFALLFSNLHVPNLTYANLHPDNLPVWPLLMVTISCGAISGFHSTQSPIIARTLKKQSDGRKVFFGAMIAEGIIALIWAAAGMTFFGGTDGLASALAAGGPASVVNEISITLLGTLGGVLAVLGVIILPITTGDTAIRSSRMMVIDLLSKGFKNVKGKGLIIAATLIVTIPAFLLSTIDYTFLWRYVGWTNQLVATVMLWTGAIYLLNNNKFHWICGVPAMFMSGVVCTYIFYAPEGFNMGYNVSMILGAVLTVIIIGWYIKKIMTHQKHERTLAKSA
ncbi:carbon starvation CstA family protein [Salipaludibacillus daqingensis]|uniref:carbon starvation CstA family protein n=1 Tax=Salipaludibacillus daqingensis TaxID=3041001 RepID=UPI00247353CC|nr:carbon starvation CstA family protein [Salipaludibacillus daqingensis]